MPAEILTIKKFFVKNDFLKIFIVDKIYSQKLYNLRLTNDLKQKYFYNFKHY